jgi:hypothetical protein
MSGRKLLIDTNVFIGLEDEREVPPDFSTLQQLCAQHGVRIFIHERAAEDVGRDRDTKRRAISLSKIRKFEQLKGVSQPPKAELEAKFGTMPKANDEVDVALLYALDINAVDFPHHSGPRHTRPCEAAISGPWQPSPRRIGRGRLVTSVIRIATGTASSRRRSSRPFRASQRRNLPQLA